MTSRLAVGILCALAAAATVAAETPAKLESLLRRGISAGGTRSAIGVTRQATPIPSLLGEGALDFDSAKTHILLIGGLDGSESSVEAAVQAWEWFRGPEAARQRERFVLSVVPVANPEGWLRGLGRNNGVGGDPASGYPPEGGFYDSPDNPEAQYLWRWTGMHAPDLVVTLLDGDRPLWRLAPTLQAPGLESAGSPASGSFAAALEGGAPSGVGSIPTAERIGARSGREALAPLLDALGRSPLAPSPARREIQARLNRGPLEVARQLAGVYGHKLPEVVYIPALALIGRLRLAELTEDRDAIEDVRRIVQPYLVGKPALGEKPTSSHLPGHLVFGELTRLTGDTAYAGIASRAADMAFDAQGAMLVSMPLHNEMSDSVFMGCAILAQTGRISGDARYFEMALRHLRFMEALDLRPDGLYRHSPLDEAAWGRGNGFPALGLAWSLAEMPENAPGRPAFLAAYRALLGALLPHQDPTGMFHQVIDHEESYRELTSTSMIGYSLALGLRNGWISGARYEQALEHAWSAVKSRIAPDGSLVDVCTGTGKQPDLRAYFDRGAILGRDDRGGAMALLFAVEMARRATSD